MINLKHLMSISLLLMLFFPVSGLAQSAGLNTRISGKINLDDRFEAVLNFKENQSGNEKDIIVPVSKSGKFSWKFKLKNPEFINITIVPKARDKQLAINFPMYIKPGTKNRFNLIYNDSTYLSIERGNLSGSNKALILYSNFCLFKAKHQFYNPPAADKLKASITSYFDTANAYVAKFKVSDPAVHRYLDVWAMNNYLGDLENVRRRISRSKDESVSVKDLLIFPKSPVEIYNHPEVRLFQVYRSLQQYIQIIDTTSGTGKSTAERLAQRLELFNQHFDNPELKALYGTNELEGYIRNFKMGPDADFEKEIEVFKKLTSAINDGGRREKLVEDFTNLRFTMTGTPMPDVTFKDVNGNPVSLKSFAGKYIYIDMWASWCVPCIAEVPNLRQLEKDYENKNILFLSISTDESLNAWKKKMTELNLTGHQLELGDSNFDKLMNIQGIPHFIMYDQSGKMMLYKAPRPGTQAIRSIFDSL